MEEDVLALQQLYPQVYHACHARHARSRSNEHRLSDRDHQVLAHLSMKVGRRLGDLAKHMGLGKPTLSEAVGRLERLGYVERLRAPDDARTLSIRLTERGVKALQGTSVLDTRRVGEVLAVLSERQRKQVLAGLRTLAKACERVALGPRR